METGANITTDTNWCSFKTARIVIASGRKKKDRSGEGR